MNRKVSERAIELILSCPDKDIKSLNVVKIAQSIDANRSYLSRCFKKAHGMSVTDFLRREKIHRAVFILDKDHDKTIERLASELGFYRVDDFIAEFEKRLAIHPERYRYLRKNRNFFQAERYGSQ